MRTTRDTERLLETYFENLPTPEGNTGGRRVLGDALAEMQATKEGQMVTSRLALWSMIMKSKTTKLAVVTILSTVLIIMTFGKWTQPVWAIEQAIEAMQKYRAVHAIAVDSAGIVFDCWARSDSSGTSSDEILLKNINGGAVWVKDNKTYFYNPQTNVIEFDDAKTVGFAQWLGPELFDLITKANNCRTVRGKDLTTGRDRIIVTGNLTDISGTSSWSYEFDDETKLPVSCVQWDNADRRGTPKVSIMKVTYFEELPDSYFVVDIPKNVLYREKAFEIPEANLMLLNDPQHGISTEGLTQDQACRRILEQIYKAAIIGDLSTVKQLAPLAGSWNDEMVKAIIFPDDVGKRLVQIVEIGSICRMGSSKLGPIAIIPVVLKTGDGKVRQEKQIVQFRRIDGKESCVVYGPYGIPSELKK